MGVEVEALNAAPLVISFMSFFMIFLVGYWKRKKNYDFDIDCLYFNLQIVFD